MLVDVLADAFDLKVDAKKIYFWIFSKLACNS